MYGQWVMQLAWTTFLFYYPSLGIITGNPGVFQSYPDPYLTKPVPATKGRGFDGLG